MRFAPRAVPPRHAFAWLREALALTLRRPLQYVALTLCWCALMQLPGAFADVAFALTPLCFGLGCALARAADEGRPLYAELALVSSTCWTRLLLAGLCVLALVLALTPLWDALASLLAGTGAGGPPPTIAPPAPGALQLLLAALWFWFLLFGLTLWFAIPLLLFAYLPLRAAFEQSMAGFMLNRFVAVIYAVLAALLFAANAAPVLAVPWFAIVSAALYTSFRDVWLGRGENRRVAPRTSAAIGGRAVNAS